MTRNRGTTDALLAVIERYPRGATCTKLALAAGLNIETTMRRLPAMVQRGLIESCGPRPMHYGPIGAKFERRGKGETKGADEHRPADASQDLRLGSQCWTIMEEIKRHPAGISVAGIVRATGMDQQSVSKRMRALVVSGRAVSSDGSPKLYGAPGTKFAERSQRDMDASASTTAARVRMAMRRLGPCSIPQVCDALGLGSEIVRHAVRKSVKAGLVLKLREDNRVAIWAVTDEPRKAVAKAPVERRADPMQIAREQRKEWTLPTKTKTRADGVKVTTCQTGTDYRFTVRSPERFFSAGKSVEGSAWVAAYLAGR